MATLLGLGSWDDGRLNAFTTFSGGGNIQTFINTLKVGDIVRMYDNKTWGGVSTTNEHEARAHSFIVVGIDSRSVDGSGIQVVDNFTGGIISQHSMTRILTYYANSLLGTYISRLPTSTTSTGSAYDDVLLGSSSANLVRANGGNDHVYARYGNDTVYGDAGNDILRGGSDLDSLFGGDNNDSLVGGFGNDSLYGGLGRDTLRGSGDADSFIFSSYGSSNWDYLEDFSVSTETIYLQRNAFTGWSGSGWLGSANFKLYGVALDSNDRVIYRQTTGEIFYDQDGSGASAAQLVSVLSNKVALTYQDFYIL